MRPPTSQRSLRADLDRLAGRGLVTRQTPMWVTNAVAVSARPEAVREIAARPDVASVVPDAVQLLAPAVVPVEPGIAATGAPELWASGRTGTGVVVATLDSGVDGTDVDLAASWRGGTGGWFDPYGEHTDAPVDFSGHGTGVTGIVVGDQSIGSSYGMAPGARWIAARVFDDRGASTASAIHQAFQWVLDPDHDPATDDAPDVVNLSWALGGGPSCDLTFQPDLAALRAAGIVPVTAAGNFGAGGTPTSASPANYPEAFAVGAITATDTLWASSSTGPSTCGSRSRVFPDVVAPGVDVYTVDRWDGVQSLTGTSVAAPHVTGALALLLQGRRGLAPDLQTQSLTATARDLGAVGADDRFGSGAVDVVAAEQWLETATAGTGDFTLRATPSHVSLSRMRAAVVTVRLRPRGGYAADTVLTVEGLDPTEARWWFVPEQLSNGHWTTRLRVTALPGLARWRPPGRRPGHRWRADEHRASHARAAPGVASLTDVGDRQRDPGTSFVGGACDEASPGLAGDGLHDAESETGLGVSVPQL